MSNSAKSIAAIALTFSLTTVPAFADTTVTLVAYTGLFQDRYIKAVIEPFQNTHPGIKINYYAQPTSAGMLGMLRASKDSPQSDVVIMDSSISKAGTDESLFVKLDEKMIPAIADLAPAARIPDIAGVGVTFDNLVLIYNTEAIKQPPKSYMDMAKPEYKGKVIIPGIPDLQGFELVMVLDKANVGTGIDGKFDKGIAAVAQIAPNVLTWEPKPDVYPPIIRGDGVIGVGLNARAQVNSETSGDKMKATIPQEGTVFQTNTINLVKGAPSTEAAKMFIAYALSPEAQKAFTESMFYAPTNTKAQINDAARDRTVLNSMDKVIPMDWIAVSKIRDQVTDAWRRKVVPLSR